MSQWSKGTGQLTTCKGSTHQEGYNAGSRRGEGSTADAPVPRRTSREARLFPRQAGERRVPDEGPSLWDQSTPWSVRAPVATICLKVLTMDGHVVVVKALTEGATWGTTLRVSKG